jgi:glycosidase
MHIGLHNVMQTAQTAQTAQAGPWAARGGLMRQLVLFLLVSSLAACSDEGLDTRSDPNASAGETCMPASEPCTVTFSYPYEYGVTSVELRGDFAPDGWDVGVRMSLQGTAWRVEVRAPRGQKIAYKLLLNGTDWVIDPSHADTADDGLGGQNSVRTVTCDLPACEPPPDDTPTAAFDWRSAVLYFVFVDRFRNGDTSNDAPIAGIETPANYQGGDYAGVTDAIEEGYFDALGVNALWLTVPMDNPNTPGAGYDGHSYSGYHGYWPSDLDAVEEHFGTLADLKTLVNAAHARGIKVLIDYAMNHVHADSALVTQHPDWFWPLDYDGKTCVCGQGCDWNDGYEQRRCWFTDYLPDWNFTNAAARAYSVDNAMSWIAKTGIDGFRLDAVKHIETEWIRDLRARVKQEVEIPRGERFYMVGETFESADRDLLKSYVAPDLLDGQFDFPLRAVLVEVLLRRSGTMHDLASFLATNDGYYASVGGVMSIFIGNHDIGRVVHTAEDVPMGAWDNGDPWQAPPSLPTGPEPFERLAVAWTFLMTSPGVPLIYYGDEIGMAGAGDPDNRRFMQTEGLSVHQTALRTHLQKLGVIRRDHPALWRGYRSTLSITSDSYAFAMSDGEQTVYVGLNRSDSVTAVDGFPDKGRDLLTGATLSGPQLNMPPRSAVVVVRD